MSTVPTLGVMLPRDLSAHRVLEFAQTADRLGFAELWVVEDLGFRGGVAQGAAVLAATRRIDVGIGILPAAVRNVAFAAMEIATLAQIFPGRLYAGLGHGMPGWLQSAGAWPAKPLTFLEDYLIGVRALLAGQQHRSPTMSGHGVSLDRSAVPAVPPPLLLGVRGPRSLALSGRLADGTVLAEPCTPEYVHAARTQISGPPDHRLVGFNVAAVDDDPRQALRAARRALEWTGEPDWAPHLAPLPFAEDFAALRRRCSNRKEFAERMPDEWVSTLSLSGTPARVRSRIDELGASGLHSSVLIPVGEDPIAALHQLGRVLP